MGYPGLNCTVDERLCMRNPIRRLRSRHHQDGLDTGKLSSDSGGVFVMRSYRC